MINIPELITKQRIKFLAKKENKEKIIEYLLKCPNIKEALNYLDVKYLNGLDLAVYEMPIEGYINLYDYIINTKNAIVSPKEGFSKSRSIYIPLILKTGSLYNLSELTTEILLDKMPNGQTVLEYVLENDQTFDFSSHFKVDSLEVAKILYKNKKIQFLRECNGEVLLSKIDGDKTVLDILKENNYFPRIKYLKETDKLNFDFNISPKNDILFEKHDGKTILEILLAAGIEFDIELNEYIDKPEEWLKIVTILTRYDQLKRIKDAPEAFLKTEIGTGENKLKIVDYLKKDELPRLYGPIKDKDIILRYINAEKFDELLICISKESLPIKISKNITILSFLMYRYVEAGNNIIDLVRSLYTNKLITQEVTVILAQYGIYLPSDYKKKIGIKSDEDMFHYIYEEEDYSIDKEAELLIKEFKKVYSDDKSSKQIMDTAITSFKRTYQTDKELAIRDMTALINLKREHPNFKLVYNPAVGDSFLQPTYIGRELENTCITLKTKYNIEVFNHELAHLVDYYLGEEKTPSKIKDILEVSKRADYLEISRVFKEINKEATELLLTEEEYEREFINFIYVKYGTIENYKRTIKSEFNQLLGSKELVLEALNDGNYSEEVMKAIVDSYFENEDDNVSKEQLVELYTETRIKAEKQIFKEELYRKSNVEFLCYENFIDAFYEGGLYEYTKLIMREDRDLIKAPMCTHDRMYFLLDGDKQFAELYANYMELKKSPNGKAYIERLKEKTDKELIEFLEEYNKSLTEKLNNSKKR